MLTSTISVSRMRVARVPSRRAGSSLLQTCSAQPLGNFRLRETCSRRCHGVFILQRSHACGATTEPSRLTSVKFWTARLMWKRAAVNTLRCLIGCTSGDFTTMWILQSSYPQLGMGPIMLLSSKALPAANRSLCSSATQNHADQVSLFSLQCRQESRRRWPWKRSSSTAAAISCRGKRRPRRPPA